MILHYGVKFRLNKDGKEHYENENTHKTCSLFFNTKKEGTEDKTETTDISPTVSFACTRQRSLFVSQSLSFPERISYHVDIFLFGTSLYASRRKFIWHQSLTPRVLGPLVHLCFGLYRDFSCS
jgi:hypothetical protein